MKALERWLEGAERPTTRRADSAAAPARRPRPKVPKPTTREMGDSGTYCSRGVHEVVGVVGVAVVADGCGVVGYVGCEDGIADVRVGVGSRGGMVGGGVGVGIGGEGGFGVGGEGGGGGGVVGGVSGGVGVGGGVGMGEEGGGGGGGGLMRWRRVRRRRVVRKLGMGVGGERAMMVRPCNRRVRSVMEAMCNTIVEERDRRGRQS